MKLNIQLILMGQWDSPGATIDHIHLTWSTNKFVTNITRICGYPINTCCPTRSFQPGRSPRSRAGSSSPALEKEMEKGRLAGDNGGSRRRGRRVEALRGREVSVRAEWPSPSWEGGGVPPNAHPHLHVSPTVTALLPFPPFLAATRGVE